MVVFLHLLLVVQASASAHGVLPILRTIPYGTMELNTSPRLRTKYPTNAGFVRALAYGACPDAEKYKAHRFLDSTTCR